MKAEELRIGNWYKDKWDYPFKVDSIGMGGINISATDDGKPYGMHVAELAYDHLFDEAFGIELTEEWLLRFGFEKHIETFGNHYTNQNCWIYLLSDSHFELELITGDERHNLYRQYQFVHTLQNVYFALTGTELELKSLPETTTK